MQLLDALGLDWKIFLAQLINFAVFYWVLAKIAVPKIREMVTKREKEIEDGLKNAEEAKIVLNQAKGHEEEILTAARSEAAKIIDESRLNAKKVEEKTLLSTQEQAKLILERAEKQVQIEKEKMLQDVKEELAEVIAIGVKNLTTEKTKAEKITSDYLKQGLVS